MGEDTTRRGSDDQASPALRALAEVVGAPGFVLPWLDRFYDDEDVELALAAATGDQSAPGPTAAARRERAHRRGVLDRDEAGAYAPASFHERLAFWAMFEGWKDVPLAVRRRLADWDVGFYAEGIRPEAEAARRGGGVYTYVLLHEAEVILGAQDRIYLWPCDCRSIVGHCRRPADVCLRFENDRGVGWEISRERAVKILRVADRAGLVHTADYTGEPSAAGAICNCCTDCCYPHLATEKLGTAGVWPVRRHVASIDLDQCRACGRCAVRCPFRAIEPDGDGRPVLTASECRGCGLCQTGCTAGAITMPARA